MYKINLTHEITKLEIYQNDSNIKQQVSMHG